MCSYLIIYPAFPILLPPATKLGQGYVFTRVCDSVHSWRGGGMSASLHAGIHPPRGTRGRHPRARHPPPQCMLGDTGNKGAICILLEYNLVTGCNEVVAKVMFLHVCVILSIGGGLRAALPPPRDLAGRPPGPGRHPPPDLAENPPWTRQIPPDLADTPPRTWQGEPPPDQADTPPDLAGRTPPPREEDCSIRSMSGRYASYWNAFLFYLCSLPLYSEIIYQ